MDVREALEKAVLTKTYNELLPSEEMLLYDLAPKVEAALRAAAREMQRVYGIEWNDKYQRDELERCVTAGIESLSQ